MNKLGLLVVMLLLAPSGASAQEAPKDSIPPLKFTLDLGYLSATGNTDVSTLSSGQHLTYRARTFELLQEGNIVYGQADDSITTEQIKTGARINFLLAKVTGLFVGAGFERNRFAGLSRRFEEDAGVAFRLINEPMDSWLVEVGGTLNQETSTLDVSRSYTSLRGATSFRHSFTKTASLQEDLEILPSTKDWNDTRVNNVLALAAPISGHVALKISYQIKFDNVPEPGFKKSDRILTTGIQVVF